MYQGAFHIYGDPNGKHYYSFGGHEIHTKPTREELEELSGMVFYMTTKFQQLPLEQICNELMCSYDIMFGKTPNEITGLAFYVRNEDEPIRNVSERNQPCFTVLSASVMGVDHFDASTPTLLNNSLESKIIDLASNNIGNIGTSIASTAHKEFNDGFIGTVLEDPESGNPKFYPPMKPLNSRWRKMAQAAVHGGPISILRGGSDDAVEVDIRGAYLEALKGEMPVIGARYEDPITGELKNPKYYAGEPSITWAKIQERGLKHGFIDATVYVRGDLKDGMAPLPLSTEHGLVFPRGRFRGVWTLPLLQMAVDFGEAIVEDVHHSFFPHMVDKIFVPFAEFLQTLPKRIGKELYVKFWGKFNQSGGWKASNISPNPIEYGYDFSVIRCPERYNDRIRKVGNEKYIQYRKQSDIADHHTVELKKNIEHDARGESITEKGIDDLMKNFFDNMPSADGGVFKSGLYWWLTEIGQLDDTFNSAYRPDLAAYISSYNIMNVYKGLRTLKPKSIIAVHVDAIWTDDIEGAQRLCDNSPKTQWMDEQTNTMHTVSDYGGWAIKRRGDLRFYACGVYVHKGFKYKLNGEKAYKEVEIVKPDGSTEMRRKYDTVKIGCSGYDSKIYGTATEKSVQSWIQNSRSRQKEETIQTRIWLNKHGQPDQTDKNNRPEFSKEARSITPRLMMEKTFRPFDGLDFYSRDWSRDGDHAAQIARWREARFRREEERRQRQLERENNED